jgi:hypothetical protein
VLPAYRVSEANKGNLENRGRLARLAMKADKAVMETKDHEEMRDR